jgi:chorismate mutase
MSVSEQIGHLKHEENVAILQSDRWGKTLPILIKEAENKGLNQEFITEIFKRVHVESIKIQRKKK